MSPEEEIGRLVVRLIGDPSNLMGMLQKTEKEIENFSGKAVAQLNSVGASMRQMGTLATASLTTPILGAAAASVKAMSDFDQAMTESTSIMGSLSDETKRAMRESAMELSKHAVQGPAELARSYYFLASAGLSAEESMAALSTMSDFAAAGAFDMAKATELLADAQAALGMKVSGNAEANAAAMKRLSDVLITANNVANASTEQFSKALTNKAGAALRSYSKSVEEGVAVLSAYADQGIKGELAGNNLSRMMLLLSQTSISAAKAHKKYGLEVFDSAGKMRHLGDIVKNLEDITRDMTDAERAAALTQMGFTAEVQQAVLPLLGLSDKIHTYERQLLSAAGATAMVSQNQMESFQNQLKLLWNRVTVLGIEIGESLIPVMQRLMSSAEGLMRWWDSLDASTQQNITTAALYVAAIGPVLVILGTMAQSLSALSALYTTLAAVKIPAFVASLTASTTVMTAARFGVYGLAAAGAVLVAKWALLDTQLAKVNAHLSETERLSGTLYNLGDKSLQDIIGQLKSGDFKDGEGRAIPKETFIKQQMLRLENEVKGAQNQLNAARGNLSTTLGGPFNEAELAIAQREVMQAEKNLEAHRNRLDLFRREATESLKPVEQAAAAAEAAAAAPPESNVTLDSLDAEEAKRLGMSVPEYRQYQLMQQQADQMLGGGGGAAAYSPQSWGGSSSSASRARPEDALLLRIAEAVEGLLVLEQASANSAALEGMEE